MLNTRVTRRSHRRQSGGANTTREPLPTFAHKEANVFNLNNNVELTLIKQQNFNKTLIMFYTHTLVSDGKPPITRDGGVIVKNNRCTLHGYSTIRRSTCARDFAYGFHLQYTRDKTDDDDGVKTKTKYIRKPCIFTPHRLV